MKKVRITPNHFFFFLNKLFSVFNSTDRAADFGYFDSGFIIGIDFTSDFSFAFIVESEDIGDTSASSASDA
jgi:hypothetical protein